MIYRREIDGLRAIAVLSVILFHAEFTGFAGGFVGVDVFFVISGYLITYLIRAEMDAGTFTLANFYERRVRRILPALIFMMLVCIPFAWAWMLPDEFQRFSQGLVAITGLVPNILFLIRRSDYFAPAIGEDPLVHTWTLGVEEQFYLLFPILLLFLVRRRLNFYVVALVIGAASLLAAEWGWRHFTMAAFYLMPTRVWEFVVGALCGYYLQRHPHPARFAGPAAALGLAMICGAVVMFSKATPSPSIYMLVPTLGAALIVVFASGRTRVGQILAHPILVGTGLVSYSAYLWHQPLFAFARLLGVSVHEAHGLAIFALLSVFAIGMGYVSWRFVEQPFRNRHLLSRGKVFLCTSLFASCMLAFGLAGHFGNGLADRIGGPKVDAIFASQDNNPRLPECREKLPPDACLYGDPSASPSFVVWGDSHADQITPAIGEIARDFGRSFLQLAFPGCAPIVGARQLGYPNCEAAVERTVKFLVEAKEIEAVVIHAYWQYYIDENNSTVANGTVEQRLIDTIGQIVGAGKKVVLIGQVPRMPANQGKMISRSAIFNAAIDREAFGTPQEQHYQAAHRSMTLLTAIQAQLPNVYLVNPAPELCAPDGFCRAVRGSLSVYRDDNHLSVSGSKLLVPQLTEMITRVLGNSSK